MKKLSYNEEFALDGRVFIFTQKDSGVSLKYIRETKAKAEFIIPTVEEMIAYFKEKGYPEELARQAHKSYSAAKDGAFIDTAGNPVKNWKAKCVNSWMRNYDKINNQQPQNKQMVR